MGSNLGKGIAIALCGLAASACTSAPVRDAAPVAERVRAHVRALDAGNATRYATAERDLDGDGSPETLVYLQGPSWCGSGGCTLLVLDVDGQRVEERGRVPVVRLPIRVFPGLSNGWHDLGVTVQGGGVIEARDAVLRFDGNRYAGNPTVPAQARAPDASDGAIAIPEGAPTQSPGD